MENHTTLEAVTHYGFLAAYFTPRRVKKHRVMV
jgi:hypothetical protein